MNTETPPPLPRNQLLAGAALAALSAVVGFWLTWGGVGDRGRQAEVPVLDRRLAETGQVTRPGSRVRLGTPEAPRRTYIPPALPPGALSFPGEPFPTTPAAPQPVPSPTGVASAPGPSAPALAPPPQPLVVPLPLRPHPPGGRVAVRRDGPAARRPARGPEASGAAERRYPSAGERRPEMPLAAAWALAEPSTAMLLDRDGIPLGSVTALPGGLAVASRSAVESARAGGVLEGLFQLLQRAGDDPDRDLALFRTDGRGALPLSPEPPRAGTELAAAPGFLAQGTFQTCMVTERLPDGLFLFRGPNLPASAGGALVNRRGELAGIVLGKPPGYPGHDYVLAADTSVLLELQEPNRERIAAGVAPWHGVPALLARDVRPVPFIAPARSNARIVPGVALGNYRIGTSRADLERVLGVGQSRSTGAGFETLAYPVYHLEFTLLQDRVVAVATTDPFYATSRGVSVGTPWNEVRPGAELEEARLGRLPGGRQLAVAPGLELEIDTRGRVQRLLVTPR